MGTESVSFFVCNVIYWPSPSPVLHCTATGHSTCQWASVVELLLMRSVPFILRVRVFLDWLIANLAVNLSIQNGSCQSLARFLCSLVPQKEDICVFQRIGCLSAGHW